MILNTTIPTRQNVHESNHQKYNSRNSVFLPTSPTPSRVFPQNGYKVDDNQELLALGAANIFGSMFGAYPASGSAYRPRVSSRSKSCPPAQSSWIFFASQVPKAGLQRYETLNAG